MMALPSRRRGTPGDQFAGAAGRPKRDVIALSVASAGNTAHQPGECTVRVAARLPDEGWRRQHRVGADQRCCKGQKIEYLRL
jgi:hypothetical protein